MSETQHELMPTKRAVIVTTTFRGIFFGYVEGPTLGKDPIQLKGARMAIYWGTTQGFMQLANTGPTPKSRISARADVEVRNVTSILDCTPEAIEAWEAAK